MYMAGGLHITRSVLARSQPTALAAGDAPPGIGPTTKRVRGMTAGDWSWATRRAEQWFGPYNPRQVPDWVLKLMSTDWSIGFVREIWVSAFHAVDYRFEGGSAEFRAFLEAVVLPRMPQFLEAVLRALDYGRQSCEIVWSQEDVAYSFAGENGKATARTKPSAYVIDSLRDLDPELVEILADETTGDYRGIRYGGVEIPGRRTVHVVNDPEFGDLHGRAQNVRSYNPWWWGNLVYLGLNRYLERKGDPPLIGFAPGEETADDSGNVQDPVRVTAIGLANLKGGGAYVFPQQFDPESKQPMYAVKALEIASRAPEFLETADAYERNKRLGWLIPYSLGAGGSFAADKVSQQIVHRMFDRRLQRLVIDSLRVHVLPKLVAYNFGQVASADIPRLTAGSMAENAREIMSELLRGAIGLEGVTPDGRAAKIVQMIDSMKLLRQLNVPTVDAKLVPDAPAGPDVGGGGDTGGARGAAGRPANIAPESSRPPAPGRPGAGLARPLALDANADAASWWSGVESGLAEIDRVIRQTEALMESERKSVEAEIKNLARKAILAAKTEDGRLSSKNRTTAASLEKDVGAVIEQSIFEDLLDESDLTASAVALAKKKLSPLARQHAAAAQAATRTVQAAGFKPPPAGAVLRGVKDVVRDANRNGRGVVIRESRRIAETVDRLVQAETPIADAEAAVDVYELPTREWVESTVHHVRASARATLAQAGLDAEAESWLVTAGPSVEREVVTAFPRGEVAQKLWTAQTTTELDAVARGKIDAGRPISSWRNLGLNFFSEEMYVPIPGKSGEALFAAVVAYAAERRAKMQREAEARQAELDARSRQ